MTESNDSHKFYNTILDIPKMISEQKEKPLTLRTHNLIVKFQGKEIYPMIILTNINSELFRS